MEDRSPLLRLAEKLARAAREKRNLAARFPDDGRYAAAADRLQRLAQDAGSVSLHLDAIFRQVRDTQEAAVVERIEDALIAAIGVSYEPRTTTDLVRAVSWAAAFPDRARAWRALVP